MPSYMLFIRAKSPKAAEYRVLIAQGLLSIRQLLAKAGGGTIAKTLTRTLKHAGCWTARALI
jgi:hypothetical protein